MARNCRHPVFADSHARMSEKGQGLAEYLIIVMVIAILVIVAVRSFGGSVTTQFSNATTSLQQLSTAVDDEGAQGKDVGTADTQGLSEYKEETGQGSGLTQSNLAGNTGTQSTLGDPISAEIANLQAGIGIGDRDVPVVERIRVDVFTLILLGVGVVLMGAVILLRLKRGAALVKKADQEDEAGQAMVEFVVSVITFLFVLLGLIQFAMVLNAFSLVRYAAYNATRAAIVHGGEKEKMLEAARISLLPVYPRHGRADHVRGYMENYLGAQATDRFDAGPLAFLGEAITDAKIIAPRDLASGQVVTFDDPTEGQDAVITVQVKHYYELVIPLVNRIIFFVYLQLRSGEGYQGETVDALAAKTDRERRSGQFRDIEFRIPLVAHYTMRLQSDYVAP